jgi:integration host factor subunit alpha
MTAMVDVKTLTRADLGEMVHREIGLSRAESAAMVERVLDLMSDAMSRGENVKISGFGTFILRDKGRRIGRNPKTGIEVPIEARRVLTFRASQLLRDEVKS